jgi:hypothetical protein
MLATAFSYSLDIFRALFYSTILSLIFFSNVQMGDFMFGFLLGVVVVSFTAFHLYCHTSDRVVDILKHMRYIFNTSLNPSIQHLPIVPTAPPVSATANVAVNTAPFTPQNSLIHLNRCSRTTTTTDDDNDSAIASSD